jgi:hypothetical protein
MWVILNKIWTYITDCFKCCCPYKINCYSTCCDVGMNIENEKKTENNIYKETDKRFKMGNLEYSYHNKNKKEIKDKSP